MVVRGLKLLHLLLRMEQLAAATSLLKNKVIQLMIFDFVFKYRNIEHSQLLQQQNFQSEKRFIKVLVQTNTFYQSALIHVALIFLILKQCNSIENLMNISHRRDSETVRRY